MTDANIRFIFEETESVPIGILSETLSQVENALFRLERADLDALEKDFPEIPSTLIDAARYRFDYYRGRLLTVQAIDKGSVEVVAAIGALCYWVVEKTIGETFRDAWKESDMHKRLKEFFLQRFKKKMEVIQYSSPFDGYQRLAPGRSEHGFSTRSELSKNGDLITFYIHDHSLLDVPITYSALREDAEGAQVTRYS